MLLMVEKQHTERWIFLEKVLFVDSQGVIITKSTLQKALYTTNAGEAEILFIHSELSFGRPNTDLRRNEILQEIFFAVLDLGVKTICVPTFTFSFPNSLDYDVKKSKSKMGAFNEFFRKQPDVIRSRDPMMSVALWGEKKYLVENIGRESIGKGCTFDLLHKEKKVKFLFLGVEPSKCFTYTHYIEHELSVPYRYDRIFRGRIIDINGNAWEDEYKLYVRYEGVEPSSSDDFEKAMLYAGVAKKVLCGDNAIYAVDEALAYELLCEKIRNNPLYMLAHDYPSVLSDRFVLNTEMVAL